MRLNLDIRGKCSNDKPKRYTEAVCLKLTPEQMDHLIQAAKTLGRSKQEVVRFIIDRDMRQS